MKMFNMIMFLLVCAVCLCVAGGAVYVVYLWWYGVLFGLAHFGIPMILGFVLMVICLWLGRGFAAFVFAAIGLWSGIALLGWPWFLSLALYFTTIAVVFTGAIIAGVIAIAAGVLMILQR